MDIHNATEQAYRNGYEAGKRDAEPKWIPTKRRPPTKESANEDGEILAVWAEGKVVNPSPAICYGTCAQQWSYVVQHPEWFPYWMPMPKPPTE